MCLFHWKKFDHATTFGSFRVSDLSGLASSQALPALKVAIDDECSGKGLAFTKNNPPDFGLLFLAQFARFSIRTETEVTMVTVHTHSQTNRHLHVCQHDEAFGSLVLLDLLRRMLDGPDRSLTRPAGQRLSQWANCECRAWCSLLRKVNLPPRGPRPTFRCLRTTFLRRVLSCSLIAMCKPVSKTIFFDPQENEKRDVSATGVYSPKPHGFRVVQHASFFSLSKPSQSMRMVLAIRLFEFQSRKDICSMYAKLLRCTVYACEAALALGKPQESGETPRFSQSAS